MFKKVITLSLFLIALAYSVWAWVFQTGLFAILVRWQVKTFDIYLPSLTFGAVFLILLVPLGLLELVFGVRRTQLKHRVQLTLPELKSRLNKRALNFFMSILVFSALAGVVFYVGQSAPNDDQPVISVDLNNYQAQNYWFKKVSLNGVFLTNKAYTITSKDNRRGRESQTRYTPIVAQGAKRQEVNFVHTETRNLHTRKSARLALTGFVRPSVLPVLVRDSFESDGLNLADTVHVIGASVVSVQMMFYIAAGILAFIAFILLMSLLFMPIGRRRILKDWHASNDDLAE